MGKIKINPSTGKVLVFRDSAGNSKLCTTCCFPGQIPTVCDACDNEFMPAKILIVLAGFVDADPDACLEADGVNRFGKFPTGTAAVLNGVHIADHGGFIATDCGYSIGIEVDDYDRDTWGQSDCTGVGPIVRSSSELRIRAIASTGFGIDIDVFYRTPHQQTVFVGDILYAGEDSCFDIIDSAIDPIATNQHIGGPVNGTGTATIYTFNPCIDAPDWVSMQVYLAHDIVIDAVDSECYMANVDSMSSTRPGLNSDWILVSI